MVANPGGCGLARSRGEELPPGALAAEAWGAAVGRTGSSAQAVAGLEYLLSGLPPPPEGASDKEYAAYAVAAAQYTQAATALKEGQTPLPLLPSVEEATALLRASGAVGPSASGAYPYYCGWGGAGGAGGAPAPGAPAASFGYAPSAGRGRKGSRHSREGEWSLEEEQAAQEKLRAFWLGLSDYERRDLVSIEKSAILREMKEQQRYVCSCSVCGRRRTVLEEELESLYDAYYEELALGPLDSDSGGHGGEGGAHGCQRVGSLTDAPGKGRRGHGSGSGSGSGSGCTESERRAQAGKRVRAMAEAAMPGVLGGPDLRETHQSPTTGHERRSLAGFGSGHSVGGESWDDDDDALANSLTVKQGALTVTDELLEDDGRRFFSLIEKLAEKRMKQADYFDADPVYDDDDDDLSADEEDDDIPDLTSDELSDDDSEYLEEQRMEEGRRMFQMFAAKMFENRLLDAYREKAALEAQERLIQEEEEAEKEKEERARLKKEKEKERKKARKERKKAAKANENADALQAKRDAEEAKAKAQAQVEEDRKAEEAERLKRHADEERQREAELKKRAAELKKEQEAREAKEAAEVAARVAAAEAAQAKVAKAQADASAKQKREAKAAGQQDSDSGQWESSSKGRRGRKQRGGDAAGTQGKPRDSTGPNLNLSALRGTGMPNGSGVAVGRMGLVGGGQKNPAQFQQPMVPSSKPQGAPAQPVQLPQPPQPLQPPQPSQPLAPPQNGSMWNIPPADGGRAMQAASPPQMNGIYGHQSLPPQGFDAGVPPPPPREKASEPAGASLEAGLDSEISRMLDLLPGDLLGGNDPSPQGVLDSAEFQVPSEPQADHAAWNDSGAFAGTNASWDVPQASGLGMGATIGQDSYNASQGLQTGSSPWGAPQGIHQVNSLGGGGKGLGMGLQDGGAANTNTSLAQRLEAGMFSIHSRILTGKINLPIDLNTFWDWLHMVDPILGSMGVGVPEVLGLWENWQQRGLINIAYNNAVQPVEPFIVGAVPVDVGKGGDNSQGEGDWPTLGNKVRDDPGGEAAAANGKVSWGAVAGGETVAGHMPVARFPSMVEPGVEVHGGGLPGMDVQVPGGAGVWGAFDGLNLAPGSFH